MFQLVANLREAVDDGRILRNPEDWISVGAKPERRVDPMHIAHVAPKVPQIADAMPEPWRAAVLLMASTGLRVGECVGLTVDLVELLRRTIRIDRQLANTHGGSGFGTIKTRTAVRTIPVPAHVIDMLAVTATCRPIASGREVGQWHAQARAARRAENVSTVLTCA